MLIDGDGEWWARFHDELRDGRYDEEVMDYLHANRPDLVEDLAVNVVLECWGEEKDELQDNKLFSQLIDAALRAAPSMMLEFFGDERWRTWWWKAEFNDQH